ncbi:Gfo/Idh/MocA family oxidoreductase [Microlunatus aurantiacus]|uniref:Gfo/Idh/MocA family oxidoreductase n=1 Tax=Microlunatus aurantiacus TaxID=446786 RepID=A0ABP7DQI4_9ACTN
MSDAPLRLVQVGAGGMGRAWLGTIAAYPDVELVGLVDLSTETATMAAAEQGFAAVPIARSVAELLDAGVAADAVVNVTVPQAHHAVNAAALAAGLPVLCEKPLAESVAECLSMVAAAELSGQLLMVSQSRRYWRAVGTLRGQLAALGPVASASCRFFKAPHFGGFRDEMPYPLLIDMAIHQFDLARLLIGSEPTSVYCRSYNPAWSWYAGDAAAAVVFELGDGVTFTFDGSWCAPGVETSWNGDWRFGTARGTATWDGDHAPVAETDDGVRLPAELPDEPEQIAGSLAEFVATLRARAAGEDVTPNGEVHTNVLSVAMVEAAVRSAETGQRVELATVVLDAYERALATERDPRVREVLAGWTSVLEVVGLPGAGSAPTVSPSGSGEV